LGWPIRGICEEDVIVLRGLSVIDGERVFGWTANLNGVGLILMNLEDLVAKRCFGEQKCCDFLRWGSKSGGL
jgi:hypothetical protein